MAEAEYWRFTVARDCQKKNTSENHSECRLGQTAMPGHDGGAKPRQEFAGGAAQAGTRGAMASGASVWASRRRAAGARAPAIALFRGAFVARALVAWLPSGKTPRSARAPSETRLGVV